MFAITYPHPKLYDPRAVLQRFGIASIMSLAVMEAGSRHGIVLMRRLLRDNVKGESLRAGIKKTWKKMQEDPDYISSTLYDRYSGINKFIKAKAATSQALELHYTYDEYVHRHAVHDMRARLTSDLWMKYSTNSRAIRNRYAVVTRLLTETCEAMMQKYGEVRIFSLASGSARAVVEVLSDIHTRYPHNKISVLLVDFDPTALKKAKTDMMQHASFVDFAAKVGNVYRLEKIAPRVTDFCPNIIEMIGFLDYISNEQSPSILQQLREFGAEHFLTCNIMPTLEMIALHAVVMWPWMVYRTAGQLSDTLIRGNFHDPDIYVEPYRIHAVAHWQKKI